MMWKQLAEDEAQEKAASIMHSNLDVLKIFEEAAIVGATIVGGADAVLCCLRISELRYVELPTLAFAHSAHAIGTMPNG